MQTTVGNIHDATAPGNIPLLPVAAPTGSPVGHLLGTGLPPQATESVWVLNQPQVYNGLCCNLSILNGKVQCLSEGFGGPAQDQLRNSTPTRFPALAC